MTALHLVHCSPVADLKVTKAHAHAAFDCCLFFTGVEADLDDAEAICEGAYVTSIDGDHIHVLDVEWDYIAARGLDLDEQAERDIRKIFSQAWEAAEDRREMECEGDDRAFVRREFDPTDILRGDEEAFVDEDGKASWALQRIRAQTARRAGYTAVKDWDEQGDVYIVDFAERENELNAGWRYVGRYSEICG
ncbi:hypothetical protein SAMN06297251_10115 [Fulvimarina manganoxydans]|uniref:Uncharacterized protein n=1 Tax=Fulvimarina manganoxydans TaxID=937218 RepID=A0A1W1Y824_9HYPH|nr:hypothetical protein [Fulvimarina manganoxydans]SMC32303.1 hypothetical protein SAMN06297251_10115 [Fulvimarina manganoxydans]